MRVVRPGSDGNDGSKEASPVAGSTFPTDWISQENFHPGGEWGSGCAGRLRSGPDNLSGRKRLAERLEGFRGFAKWQVE